MLSMRKDHGFSLTELLVGLVIVAILASIGAPSLQSWTQNTQLRNAAESISNALQLARAEAVRRNANVSFTLVATHTVPGTTLPDASWTVGCVTPVGDLDGDGVDDCPARIQSQSTAEVPPNVTVGANVNAVAFTGLGRALSDMALELRNPKGGNCTANGGPMRCLNAAVNKAGQIRICNPALSHATDPQGC